MVERAKMYAEINPLEQFKKWYGGFRDSFALIAEKQGSAALSVLSNLRIPVEGSRNKLPRWVEALLQARAAKSLVEKFGKAEGLASEAVAFRLESNAAHWLEFSEVLGSELAQQFEGWIAAVFQRYFTLLARQEEAEHEVEEMQRAAVDVRPEETHDSLRSRAQEVFSRVKDKLQKSLIAKDDISSQIEQIEISAVGPLARVMRLLHLDNSPTLVATPA